MKGYCNKTSVLKKVQIHKKQLLEREIAWIKREFKDFNTLNDLDIYNTTYYRYFLTDFI